MKNSLLLLLATFFLISCAHNKDDEWTEASLDEDVLQEEVIGEGASDVQDGEITDEEFAELFGEEGDDTFIDGEETEGVALAQLDEDMEVEDAEMTAAEEEEFSGELVATNEEEFDIEEDDLDSEPPFAEEIAALEQDISADLPTQVASNDAPASYPEAFSPFITEPDAGTGETPPKQQEPKRKTSQTPQIPKKAIVFHEPPSVASQTVPTPEIGDQVASNEVTSQDSQDTLSLLERELSNQDLLANSDLLMGDDPSQPPIGLGTTQDGARLDQVQKEELAQPELVQFFQRHAMNLVIALLLGLIAGAAYYVFVTAKERNRF